MHIDANREWGGGQAQSLGLALALAARGEETFFVAQPASALAIRLGEAQLEWEPMRMRGLSAVGAAFRLARLLGRRRPEILHVHDGASLGPAVHAAESVGGIRTVTTRRTVFPARRGRLGWARWAARCDRVICISEAVRSRCLEAGLGEELLAVIPDFVDCRHFAPEERAEPGRVEGRRIVTVARLTREKGHRTLLRAMQEVARAEPEARAVICGEGEEGPALRELAERLGIAANVEFTGFVGDVRKVLRGAEVFAMPSLAEGLGVAVLEAMAMGKPVVATDAGGLPEAVAEGETGLVVPAGDASALGDALVELLRNRERGRAMGRAGRARARALFDRGRVVERVVALYDEVLGKDRQ